MEGLKEGQYISTDTNRVLYLWSSNNIYLDGKWCKNSHIFWHDLTEANEHITTTINNNYGINILEDIHILFHDSLKFWIFNAIQNCSIVRSFSTNLSFSSNFVSFYSMPYNPVWYYITDFYIIHWAHIYIFSSNEVYLGYYFKDYFEGIKCFLLS